MGYAICRDGSEYSGICTLTTFEPRHRMIKQFLRSKFTQAYDRIRNAFIYLESSRLFGFSYRCPICGGHFRKFLPTGTAQRPNAVCPRCGSHERHRLLWLYLKQKTDLPTSRKRLLHFAPEVCLQRRFAAMRNVEYISADLSVPNAAVRMDITAIVFPDNTFDCILCSHVLEHIPDDRRAMAELYRVLKPGGWAILQVPMHEGKTYENPAIVTPDGRLRHFGQEDHVRKYGADYGDRLRDAGFTVTADPFIFGFDDAVIDRYRLVPEWENKEYIYLCRK
jgi:DNA-directed RNA polymerase subunit RPC12/RpoP